MFQQFRQWFAHPRIRPRFHTLRLETLEDRSVPAGLFVAGVGGITQASDPEVSIYIGSGPGQNQQLGIQLEGFGGTAGDTRVALGDVNGDGTDDIILAGGFNSFSDVVIFDGFSALQGIQVELTRFEAYENFAGGIHVTAGDIDHDGLAEVMTTPGLGGRGHLKVFGFSDGTGTFTSTPNLLTSAYTFGDYDGEVRIATMKVNNEIYVVTASGAGVPGDIRAFSDADLIGFIPDGTPVDPSFLVAQVFPFGGYDGGLSIAAGDTDRDGNDELFVAKNDGFPTIEVYDLTAAISSNVGIGLNAGSAPPAFVAQVDNAFDGFLGPIRLGASDVDGDGFVEVLATTGFSGDPQGTPVKAFSRFDTSFIEIRSFFANPGYLPGAWLAGKDFTYSQDVVDFQVTDENQDGSLPAIFESNSAVNPDGALDIDDVALVFPENAGGFSLPTESVTGAGLSFRDLAVTFGFDHAFPSDVTVSLIYVSNLTGEFRTLTLFDGPNARNAQFNGLQVTFIDNAPGTVPDGTAGQIVSGRFRPDGGSLADFVRTLPDRDGVLGVLFEDSVTDFNGTVLTTPTPFIRLLY